LFFTKSPKSFQENYNPISFEVINPVNFWEQMIEDEEDAKAKLG
jgi:hypothetical protein